jgi:hypothetical protein
MVSVLWFVILAVACVWVVSLLAMGVLALLAQRRHPSVVVDDPWETLPVQRQFDLLRSAVAQARADSRQGGDDFHRWEDEVRLPARPGAVHRRPRPAA